MNYPENIESIIKNFYLKRKSTVKTSAGLDEKIVGDALLAQKKLKTTQSAATRPNSWRITMRGRMTKYVAAAVIALVLIIGIIELGKPVAGANVVFAAAMDSVRRARTFSCTRISEVRYQDGQEHGTYLSKEKRMFKEPDWERHESMTSPWPQYVGEVTIRDYGQRQELTLRPAEKTARLRDLVSDYTIDEKTGELKLTQLDTRLRDRILEWSAGAVEDLGNVKLDGRTVRMLQSRKGNRVTTVWVNPKTHYPVQIEKAWADQKRPPVVFASIQIDAELDDSLFSLEPPDGYALSVEEPGCPDYKRKLMTKVKLLSLWCVMYMNDNHGQFPGELEDVVKWGVTTREVLNKILAGPDDPDEPPAIRYHKPNVARRDPSTEIILYENYDQWPDDGVVVGFVDGHSELIVDQNRFEELMK